MNKLLKFGIWPLLAAPAIYLMITWNNIPALVPLHFGPDGHADRIGAKKELWLLVAIMTGLAITIYLLLPSIYKIDPKKTAIDNKSRLQKLAFAIALLLSFVCFICIRSAVTGSFVLNINLLCGVLGVFWCVIGNYMYNLKPNYFAGIRVPWTLHNEDNWKLTHRLAGKLWFIAGLMIVILSFLLSPWQMLLPFIGITMITAIIPIVYSYVLFRESKKSHA